MCHHQRANCRKHQRLGCLNVVQRQKSETHNIKRICNHRIAERRRRFMPNEKDETNRTTATLLRVPKKRKCQITKLWQSQQMQKADLLPLTWCAQRQARGRLHGVFPFVLRIHVAGASVRRDRFVKCIRYVLAKVFPTLTILIADGRGARGTSRGREYDAPSAGSAATASVHRAEVDAVLRSTRP